MSKQMFSDTRKVLCELFGKLIKAKDAFIIEAKQIYREAREDYEKKKAKQEPKG